MNHVETSSAPPLPAASAGLGLRRSIAASLLEAPEGAVDFLEVAPENWIGVGGKHAKTFAALAERHPILCHGLSLSLGGPAPLDMAFVARVRDFLDRWDVPLYSEHLSWCADEGHLYDLIPLPFTEESVAHVSSRIRQVQDALGRRIAVENISYYAAPWQAMPEIDFINAVLSEADCDLLLDVNNIHVNATNHGYDPLDFLHALPSRRVRCIHVAGHYVQSPELLIDTHGAPVIDPVWRLLQAAYRHVGVMPTLLERDFNFPTLSTLLEEVDTIRTLQRAASQDAPLRHVA
ncbi:DUF692 domain-containing protein [Xanthomonadaceae bacterium JHOS43]|nr:DUF692 domain-containing protein [Xanthomonadaceae bacterium JHOS43]MCX7563228.1 DUF692 domain-containing protein [Xanthomonadaceae bacterium XH05]